MRHIAAVLVLFLSTTASIQIATAPVRSMSAFHARSGGPRATLQNVDEFVVSLTGPGDEDSLPCYVSSTIDHSGDTFAALCPVNVPISLAELSGGRLVPVDETEELVRAAIAECSKVDIELLDTPVVLTAQGAGLRRFVDDAEEKEEKGETEEPLPTGSGDGDSESDGDGEEAIVLTDFEYMVRTLPQLIRAPPSGALRCPTRPDRRTAGLDHLRGTDARAPVRGGQAERESAQIRGADRRGD